MRPAMAGPEPLHGSQHPVRQGRDAGDLGPRCMADRVQDRGRGRDQDMLTQALGTIGAFGSGTSISRLSIGGTSPKVGIR